MILLTKDRPTKARCAGCRRLYEPTQRELVSTGQSFVCGDCLNRAALAQRFDGKSRKVKRAV